MASQDVNDFFGSMYDTTQKKVLTYITSKCGKPEDISDIFQETYLELYEVLTKHGESYFQNPGGFVMQLAKRKIYKHYSLRERFGNVISLSRSDDEQTAEIDPAEFETCIAQDDWPETAATNSVLIEQIGGYLKKQPADVQKIFRLYYYLDLQINEIAAELDMTESNVKNRLYRTLKALRKEFDVEG